MDREIQEVIVNMFCHHYIYKCRGLSSIIDDSSYVLPQYIKEKITTQQGFKEKGLAPFTYTVKL